MCQRLQTNSDLRQCSGWQARGDPAYPPDTCFHWITAWACRRLDYGPCIWEGRPPLQFQGPPPEEDCDA